MKKSGYKSSEDERVDSLLNVVEILVSQMKIVRQKIGLHATHLKSASKEIKKKVKQKKKVSKKTPKQSSKKKALNKKTVKNKK